MAGELYNERDLQGVAVGWAGDMGFQNRVEPLASAIDKAAARAGPRNARLIEQYRAAMRREDEHRDGPQAVRCGREGAAWPLGMLLRDKGEGDMSMACVWHQSRGWDVCVVWRAVVVLTDRWSEAAAMAAWGLTKQGRQAGMVRSLLGGGSSQSRQDGEEGGAWLICGCWLAVDDTDLPLPEEGDG